MRIQGRTLKQSCMDVVSYIAQEDESVNTKEESLNESGEEVKVEVVEEEEVKKEAGKLKKEEMKELFRKYAECTICLNRFQGG